MQIDL